MLEYFVVGEKYTYKTRSKLIDFPTASVIFCKNHGDQSWWSSDKEHKLLKINKAVQFFGLTKMITHGMWYPYET